MRGKALYFILALVSMCIFCSIFVFAKGPPNKCPINSETNIVFYGETGIGGVAVNARSWTIHFLDWWEQQDSGVNYIELDSADIKTDCDLDTFSNLKLYIQPGGSTYKQQLRLGQAGKDNILSFIDAEKAFLGICAGFYYAAADHYWQEEYQNLSYTLDRYATVEGSITDIADYDVSPGYAITTVSGFEMLYWGGPTRGWQQTPASFPGTALLTYDDISGNLPAAIKDDNLLLVSAHPEAYENDGFEGLTTEQRIENYKWLANAINDVAGTNFYVPPYSSPACACSDSTDNDNDGLTDYPNDPGCTSADDTSELGTNECDDGLDNDGDGNIDTADTGCTSPSGTDETDCGDGVCEGGETLETCQVDCQGPVELFFDGFESGLFETNGWITYGQNVRNNWEVSTDLPYEGTYHAQIKYTGSGNLAYVETSIDTTGYGNIKFSYYRQMLGLDSVDDFSAEWFDGSSWQYAEHIRGNDASYVFKEFSLPSEAANNPEFKIRFMCEANAFTEGCRVDNVKIISG